MKKVAVEEFPGLLVIRCSAPVGYVWRFNMRRGDISLGAVYKDKHLTIVAAARPDIVGQEFSGFYSFAAPENAKFNVYDEWQECRVDNPLDWICFHSDDGTYKSIQLVDPATVAGEGEFLYRFDDKAVLLGK